jgi:hypothetical protein
MRLKLVVLEGGRDGAGGRCTGSACNAQVMPPTGQVTLSGAELGAIQKWIADGAAAPMP